MSATPSSARRGAAGFSLAELVVSICVMLILTALAIPSLMHSLRAYQLNQTAAAVSDMLKFTRFEAVRRNTQINLQVTQNGTSWIVWTDALRAGNGGPIDPRDKQQLITGFATLLPAGAPVPAPTAITAALGGGALTTLSGANNTVTFDARGAIRLGIGGGVSNLVYVFYVGSNGGPDYGYRAVVLLPNGSTQIWTASTGGPWRQVS
ncbi:MAG TPA: GspH/FimT family pseudopilin [Candidatus Dormibacteraeota bacterium]|nr:GspH/FimT family pseudopilin [Candidatus Dormibacteraeota bacterium]